MEFYVSIIQVIAVPNSKAMKSLGINCQHILSDYWIMEGDLGCLKDDGIKFTTIEEDVIVGSLGDYTPSELLKYICQVSDKFNKQYSE